MNILHMRYAVETARCGSINMAAAKLLVAQPNVSRSIRELEEDLGITIFERSARGMKLTAEGSEFIRYAEKILFQIDEVERMYLNRSEKKKEFSISVPRASYIADAFVSFSLQMGKQPAEYSYMETNAAQAIENILYGGYRLGIIRYAADYEPYFKQLLEEKGLAAQEVASFFYVLIMSKRSLLAKKKNIDADDLKSGIEIAHGDPYVPTLPGAEIRQETLSGQTARRIYLFERGGQFDLLSENPETFMWVSPIPEKLLKRYGLVQKTFRYPSKIYKDVLIRRKANALNGMEKQFLSLLQVSKERCFAACGKAE